MIWMKKYFNRFLEYADKVEDIGNFKLFLLYLSSYIMYKATIKDFFTYKFYMLNSRGKKLFVTGGYLMKMYKRINNPEFADIMKSKEETFLKYNKWMKRKWCGVRYNNTCEDYREFVKSNSKCIVKPLDSLGGFGIRVIELENMTGDKLRQRCIENNEMVEELIVQHEKMRLLYPGSVNTIRIITENGEIIGAAIRIGSGGSVVDNACSGGMFANINISAGMIVSGAFNYEDKEFLKHPDTNVTLPGFEIPMWDKCIALVKSAVEVVPEIPVVGFDIAITPDGPTLVEVNEASGMSAVQHPQTIKLTRRMLRNH